MLRALFTRSCLVVNWSLRSTILDSKTSSCNELTWIGAGKSRLPLARLSIDRVAKSTTAFLEPVERINFDGCHVNEEKKWRPWIIKIEKTRHGNIETQAFKLN